jgi:predicted ribosomally synthesized peptide with SipW-like signal peptide
MKKFILIMAAALLVAALVTAGITIAWFTDTKETTNVFTAGDVKIRLTEITPENQILDVTDHGAQMDYGLVYPGYEVKKNSTVTNIGSEAAYLAAEIVILDGDHDINSVLYIPGTLQRVTALNEFFKGGVWGESFTRMADSAPHFITWESANYIVRYDTRMTDGFWINVFVKHTLESGYSLHLWDGFTFPDTWDNGEMLECTNLRISIKVFAAQAAGFSSCVEAITSSFGEDFGMSD